MTLRRSYPVFCLLAAFTLAGVAHADEGRRQARGADGPQRAARADAAATQLAPPARPTRAARADALADSVRRVQSRTGGQVLSAERVPFEGRDINRVKVVDERGRVRVYMDDPASRPRRPPRPTRGDDD